MLTVNEIFFSIQGESSFSGLPCVFVRLTACDLRCRWCDTTYAFDAGTATTVNDVVSRVESYDCSLVEVTGGEPLLQQDVYSLMHGLLESGKTVLLETGGHIDISDVPDAVIKVVDVKCPRSGEVCRNDWENLDRLAEHDQVKFVIQDRSDYDFARDVISKYGLWANDVHAYCFLRCMASLPRLSSPIGCFPIAFRSVCRFSYTSTSGNLRREASSRDHLSH